MKKIIDRPVLATIFFIIVVIMGVYSLKNTPIELVPDAEEGLPSLSITYNWNGTAPDVVLQKVLIPAEKEIMDIKGIKKITSRAQQNRGTIKVEFMRDTRMNFAEVQLSEKLNRLQTELPKNVRNPIISQQIPDEFEQKPAFEFGVYGDLSAFELKKIVDKEIHPYLKSINGVDDIAIRGGVEPEIKINTFMEKLNKFNINIDTIRTKINQYFFNKKSITLTKEHGEIVLSLTESPDEILNLQEIIILTLGEKKIRLKEVADVYLGNTEIMTENRFQGFQNIGFLIYKEANYSSTILSEKIREKLQYLADKLKGKVKFAITADQSKDLNRKIIKLIKIAFLILVIIFVILILIVRDIKATILIFSSVFFSVFTTFTFIFLFKIPLNLLTLSGLALGFGLFVDNAVVVFDSILRFRERGFGLKESAVEGAKAVVLPVLSSTLTTIIVFFSFALVFQERLRVFYLPLAYIIAISLTSSIIVSFVLIPSLSSRIKIKIKKNKKVYNKGRFFPFILKYPLVIIIPVIFALFFSYTTFKEDVTFGRFFSWNSNEYTNVRLRFPAGSEFENIKESILKFERIALSKDFKMEVDTYIYPNGAFMKIDYPDDIKDSALPIQLEQDMIAVASNLAGVGVMVSGFSPEPYYYNPDTGSSMPYQIRLEGYNFEKLLAFSNELKDNILNKKRIKDVDIQTDTQSWWGGKEKYFAFKLNREKLRRYKMQPVFFFSKIRSMLAESTGTQKIKFDDKELSIEIKAEDVKSLELFDMLNRHIQTPEGIPFRIKDIVDIEFTTQKGGITRENQEYISMVMWDYLGSAKAADRYHKTLYERVIPPPGFSKSLEEVRWRMTEEEESQIWQSIVLSLFLIYIILGMLYENIFQPFLIMLSIPLALIGVFIAFNLFDYTWDSTAYIGVILLFGIVVNNAILLIDNINQHVRKSSKIIESIIIGTKERIRPIFMTSATTVLGMLPLIIFKDDSGTDIWSSLALCTVGGLTTSAFLILFVLPVFYYLFFLLQNFLFKKPEKNV